MTDAHEGRDVEDASYSGPAAVNRAWFAERAAVVVQGSDADQHADLLPRAGSQLRQGGDQGAGRLVADAGNALEQVLLGLPDRRGLQALIEFVVQLFELPFDELERGLQAFPDRLGTDDGQAIRLGR